MDLRKDKTGNEGPRRTTEKNPRNRPRRTGRAAILYYSYIGLTVLAGLVVVGYVLWTFLSAPPQVDPPDIERPIVTVDPSGNPIEDGPKNERKDQFYTFLVAGQSQEEGGNLTDSMMLAAYDVPNQKLSIMSLPRDTYVNLNGRNVLLNTVYTRSGSGERGIDMLKKEVGELTGVYPDFYVLLKWEAFGELVDAIDGVEFDVPVDMEYDDPYQDLHISVKKGLQMLDGAAAMGVVRFREGTNGYFDGDLGRIRTQQGLLKAIIKKCLDPTVLLSNLGSYLSIFQRNVTTDLSIADLTYFVKSAVAGLNMDNVYIVTMPNREAGDGAHLLAQPREILAEVNANFNPYTLDVEYSDLDVVTSVPIPTPAPTPKPTPTPAPTPTPEPEDSPAASQPAVSPSPAVTDRPPEITPAVERQVPVLTPPPAGETTSESGDNVPVLPF